MSGQLPPSPSGPGALPALGAMIRHRSLLPGLEILHRELGDIFRIPLPGFSPVVLVGPEAAHFVYVTGRENLLWRTESDPVTRLLRHGVLVEDGEVHLALRRNLNPSLHRSMLASYVDSIVGWTDQVSSSWDTSKPLDMLVEMRRLTLLILVDTLFGEDLSDRLRELWSAILRTLRYISPGLWLLWRDAPRLGYARARRRLDGYLFQLIRDHRLRPAGRQDLISSLIEAGLSDDLIRDQVLTMLIAGHDTSTALLSWTLHLLGDHPEVMEPARAEVELVLGTRAPQLEDAGKLKYLDQIVNESLRLYPPIHLSSRKAAVDFTYQDYLIPAGTRVMQSIYLTHRDPTHWPDPERFDPDRFSPHGSADRPFYAFIPFGGGARNCIGLAFARLEAQLVLARLLQRFRFTPVAGPVHPYMGATLEPKPAVWMRTSPQLHGERVTVTSAAK